MKKQLALFDFDGTITTRDTLFAFIRFYHGTFRFYIGFLLLSPILIAYKLKLIPNWRAKEIVLQWFFKGVRAADLQAKGEQFVREVLPPLLRPEALVAIRQHQQAGTEVVLVSASAEAWVKPWSDTLGITCLATRLEEKAGVMTGKLSGANCFGAEKENRVRACYNLADYDVIHAYGDSSGDREMLALADHAHFKPFRN